MTWYVVFCERKQGVFSTWKECHDQVSGYPGACFKGYRSRDEAEEAFQHVHNKSDFKIREEPIKRIKIFTFSIKDVIILVQSLIILLLLWQLM
jgi:ribonuclease HI